MKKSTRIWLIALAMFFSIALVAPSCIPLNVTPQNNTDTNDGNNNNNNNNGNTSKGKK